MTQFQPPPIPPGDRPDEAYGPLEPIAPAPMSAAAVTGFVCSLLGCAGITALAGFVFGIIGIAKTRDGVRRGRGLAIAAIPISVVTGVGSVVIAFAAYVSLALFASTARITVALPEVLAADPALFAEAEAALRPLCSDAFNEDVSSEALHAWLVEIASTHGKLVEHPTLAGRQPVTTPGYISWEVSVRFDHGEAKMLLRFAYGGATDLKLDDIKIAGVSPREP